MLKKSENGKQKIEKQNTSQVQFDHHNTFRNLKGEIFVHEMFP